MALVKERLAKLASAGSGCAALRTDPSTPPPRLTRASLCLLSGRARAQSHGGAEKRGYECVPGPPRSRAMGSRRPLQRSFHLPETVEDIQADDHYHNLGLQELTFNASEHHVKEACQWAAPGATRPSLTPPPSDRKALLKYHPDKANDDDDSGKLRQLFDAAQAAYDVLGDSQRRRQCARRWPLALPLAILIAPLRPRYDSTFDFDDSIPTGDEPNFFAVFGETFKRNARFSEVKPVPMLGDESTPDEEVERFYKFWCEGRAAGKQSQPGQLTLRRAQACVPELARLHRRGGAQPGGC